MMLLVVLQDRVELMVMVKLLFSLLRWTAEIWLLVLLNYLVILMIRRYLCSLLLTILTLHLLMIVSLRYCYYSLLSMALFVILAMNDGQRPRIIAATSRAKWKRIRYGNISAKHRMLRIINQRQALDYKMIGVSDSAAAVLLHLVPLILIYSERNQYSGGHSNKINKNKLEGTRCMTIMNGIMAHRATLLCCNAGHHNHSLLITWTGAWPGTTLAKSIGGVTN
jgi:hypothetical protein